MKLSRGIGSWQIDSFRLGNQKFTRTVEIIEINMMGFYLKIQQGLAHNFFFIIYGYWSLITDFFLIDDQSHRFVIYRTEYFVEQAPGRDGLYPLRLQLAKIRQTIIYVPKLLVNRFPAISQVAFCTKSRQLLDCSSPKKIISRFRFCITKRRHFVKCCHLWW